MRRAQNGVGEGEDNSIGLVQIGLIDRRGSPALTTQLYLLLSPSPNKVIDSFGNPDYHYRRSSGCFTVYQL